MNLIHVTSLILIGISVSFNNVDAKVFSKCELARFLNSKGVSRTFIPHWICLAEAESQLDSSMKILANNKFSTKYGIFQLNSKTDNRQWCTENSKGGKCNAKCSDFLDDNLTDDLSCALQVHEAHGFKNWAAWERKCKGRDKIIATNVVRCFSRRRRRSE